MKLLYNKNLNTEIKNHFTEKKRSNVRRNILPGNVKSLRRAVAEAKDLNQEEILERMLPIIFD